MVGILIALVLRGLFILAGAALIENFSFIFYIFGAFLLYTAIRQAFEKHDDMEDTENYIIKFLRKRIAISDTYDGASFDGDRRPPFQIVQSHALSFFHLSSPDFLLGHDSDPAKRNVMGLIAANPEVARRGIRLRQFGQEVIEVLSGKRIHSTWVDAGRRRRAAHLGGTRSDRRLAAGGEGPIQKTLTWWKREMDRTRTRRASSGTSRRCSWASSLPTAGSSTTTGKIRFVDSTGNIVADRLPRRSTRSTSARPSSPGSYLKFPYYKPLGYPGGMYRVGPLARLNIATTAARPSPTRNWPSSASSDAAPCSPRSTTTTRG